MRFCSNNNMIKQFIKQINTTTNKTILTTPRSSYHNQSAAYFINTANNNLKQEPIINNIELPTNVGSCCSFHSFITNDITRHHNTHQHQHQHQHDKHCKHYTSGSSNTSIPHDAVGDKVIAVETNNIRYGIGALNELGIAIRQLTQQTHGSTSSLRVIVFTDKNIRGLEFFDNAIKSLNNENCQVHIYDNVSVEPTDQSWKDAIEYSKNIQADAYISIGGGSVMDTCKASNLYTTHPTANFLDYVNKPIGNGIVPPSPLKPHIACPTTAGTGSESTGIAICDILDLNVKTGVAHKLLRPTMAIIDPVVTHSMPPTVTVASAFDVMCHALESYTAIPHYNKPTSATPRDRFLNRPLSQGSNRWADMGCLEALRILGKHIVNAKHGNDKYAREELMYASMLAGIAFGNSGVHIPHAMSYSVAGNVQSYKAPHYNISEGAIVPHGMAVVLNAPAAFKLTTKANVVRHYEVAEALGADVSQVDPNNESQVSELLQNKIIQLMRDTDMPNGLHAVGYTNNDLDTLVKGAAQQQRLLTNAPFKIDNNHLQTMYKDAMKYW